MKETDIKHVAVIGAGLMGFGIAVEFARFGYETSLYNTREESSRKAMKQARGALDLMVETELMSSSQADEAYARMHPTTDLKQAAQGADYISESVLEKLELKKEIFAQLDEICPPPTILSTNTSGFRVSAIAEATRHPERVVAAHYFQPPHFVPLVEVAPGEKTSPEVLDVTAALMRRLRKKVAKLNMEIPGFIGNRIQGVIAREAMSLVDKGVADPQLIDEAISYGFGRRMTYTGYFMRLDLIGLDFVATQATERGREPWGPIGERVQRGDLGMKTGRGFYDWPGDSAQKLHRSMNLELIRLMKKDMEEGAI